MALPVKVHGAVMQSKPFKLKGLYVVYGKETGVFLQTYMPAVFSYNLKSDTWLSYSEVSARPQDDTTEHL